MIIDCVDHYEAICDNCHDLRLNQDGDGLIFATEQAAEMFEDEFTAYCEFCQSVLLGNEQDNTVIEWWDYDLERRRER